MTQYTLADTPAALTRSRCSGYSGAAVRDQPAQKAQPEHAILAGSHIEVQRLALPGRRVAPFGGLHGLGHYLAPPGLAPPQ